MVTPYLQRLQAARGAEAGTPDPGLVQARRRSRFEPGPAEPRLSTVLEPLEREVETEARQPAAPGSRERYEDSLAPAATPDEARPGHAGIGPPPAAPITGSAAAETRPRPAGGPADRRHQGPPTARAIAPAARHTVRPADVEPPSPPPARPPRVNPLTPWARVDPPAPPSQDTRPASQRGRDRPSDSPSPASPPPRTPDIPTPPPARPKTVDHTPGETTDTHEQHPQPPRQRPSADEPGGRYQATASQPRSVTAQPAAIEAPLPKPRPRASADEVPAPRRGSPSTEAVAPLLATAAGLAAEAAGRSRQTPAPPPPAPEIEVTVTIGRLEVRSAPSPSPSRAPSSRSVQRAPSSLDQYLQARSARRLG